MNAMTLRRHILTSLAMAVTMTLSSAGASAQSSNGMAAVASATSLRPGDAIRGSVSNAQPLHVVIALKLRNRDQLDSLVAAHQTLTSERFATLHAPTQVQAQAVADYLARMGFKNVVIAPNRMLVSANGTAGDARQAFLTSFWSVKTKEGRIAFANGSDAYIPAALQDSVLSVIGLQDVYRAHTFAQRMQPKAGAHTLTITGHNPVEFSSIYGGNGVKTAAGVTVGIISEGDITQTIADLNTFTANNNLRTVTTKTVYVDGDSGDTSATPEWNLDSQDIVGMGGGLVGRLIFYTAFDFTNASLISDFNAVVSANTAKIINVSLGECEIGAERDGSAAATDQIFQTAIAQGQTFSVSSGDSGANECGTGVPTAEWPANSPYVVAVGGTRLDASTTTWAGETVWAGAGGAPSLYEPKPNWQDALVPGTKRGVPDVALDADPDSGAVIVLFGGPAQFGGTSLASPIFVGMWARVIATKGVGIGFAAPLLYQLPTIDFHDVTIGNNGGEIANVGYDFASGRGSIILSRMVGQAGAPSPLVVNFNATANGLIAQFTDRSTDSAGTIVSHTWTFGDGGASVATNPGHVYARAGTYSVTESVTDTAGYAISKTTPLTVGHR